MNKLKNLCIAFVAVAALCMLSLLQGCATTGTLTPELIKQSAAVDTALSQLQGQQTESAQAAQAVSDTAESIQQTAGKINNPELTAQIQKLNKQAKILLDSQQAERDKTAQVQTNNATVKTAAGTVLINQSAQTALLALYKKWIWRLGITLAALVLLIVLYIVLKITGKLPF
jgi:hypothetical protein